jgi:sortase A
MNTVLPHDTSLLSVLSGRDLCTLVTCTPIGVNTHRLLVRGERIPYEVAEVIVEEIVPEEIPQSNWERQYLSGLLVGLGAVSFLVMVVAMIYYYRRFCHGQR